MPPAAFPPVLPAPRTNFAQIPPMHPVLWRTQRAMFGPENLTDVNACVYPPQPLKSVNEIPLPHATAGMIRDPGEAAPYISAISKLSQVELGKSAIFSTCCLTSYALGRRIRSANQTEWNKVTARKSWRRQNPHTGGKQKLLHNKVNETTGLLQVQYTLQAA